MNRLLNKQSLNRGIAAFLVLSALLFLSNITKIFLPLTSQEKSIVEKSDMPFKNYKTSKQFAVIDETQKVEQKVEAEVYKLDNLELKGVIAQEGGEGWAVLVDKATPNKSEFLKKDDEFKGYKLSEIKEYEVIFIKENKKYSVVMKKPDFKALAETPPPLPATNILDDKNVVRSIPKREVSKYKTNYGEIWKNIAIKEIVKEGKIEGFKVNRIKEGSIFEQLGLKVGDVIVGVNNKKLESYADAFKIYNNIDKYESLKFTIMRDNQEREIMYEVF